MLGVRCVWVVRAQCQLENSLPLLFGKLYYCGSTDSACLWMSCRSVGVGTSPGGPGREVEELAGRVSAYGAHTITHRQRKGEVFYVQNHPAYTLLLPLSSFTHKFHKDCIILDQKILWCVCYIPRKEVKYL